MHQLNRRTQVYSNNDVQIAIRQGLGVGSPSERDLFELNRDGVLPDMNNFLRERMPQLFNFFARENPWIMTINRSNWVDGNRDWPYVLLARNNNRSLVPVVLNGRTNPTISDFRDHSGRKTCPDAERVVYIGGSSLITGKLSCTYIVSREPFCTTATVEEITPKTVGKWIQPHDLGVSASHPAFLVTDNAPAEDSGSESSDDEMSVEIINPSRQRPVTRSVSTKRPADDIERDGISSPPPSQSRAKRTRRDSMTIGISHGLLHPILTPHPQN